MPTRSSRLHPIAMAAALLVCAAHGPAQAQAIAPSGHSEGTLLNIPAQPAEAAVQLLLERTGFQLLYASELLRGINSRAVNGRMSAREALQRMLEGSGLQIIDTGPNAATLRSKPSALQSEAGSPDGTDQLQRVLVTGSSIKRINVETASPLQVISKESIQASGANNLQQVLEKLPSSMPALVDKFSMYTGMAGASQANMRGLGAHATLVLLNGRRLSSYGATEGGQFQFVNIDALPSAAIERIEVLMDGASAIYGSDAIGGVINVITNSNFTGANLYASRSQSLRTHSHGEANLSVSYGVGDFNKDRFNVFGTLSHFKRDAVNLDKELPFAGYYLSENPGYLPSLHLQDGAPPTVINPGTLFTYDADGRRKQRAAPGCLHPVSGSTGTACYTNSFSLGNYSIPASARTNLFLSGRAQLADNWELFGELSYTFIDFSVNTGVPSFNSGSNYQWYARRTGTQIQSLEVPWLSATHLYNSLPAELKTMNHGVAGLSYKFLDDLGFSRQRNTDKQYRLLAGVSGSYAGWDIDSAVALAATKSVQKNRGANLSVSGLAKAFGPLRRDEATGSWLMSDTPAYQFGQHSAANLALLEGLYPWMIYEARDRIATWDAKLSREVLRLPAGPVQLAMGVNLMHEKFDDPGNALAASGDITWQGGSWTVGARTTGAVFAEALIPVTKTLEANLAGRIDKYPGFGAHAVPKLGIKYQPLSSLLLRGTYSQGFRAPSLAESGTGGIYAQGTAADTLRCSQTNAMVALMEGSKLASDRDLAASLRGSECGDRVIGSIVQPNQSLKPETARIATVGFVFNPSKQFDVSADYFYIHRRNEIVSESLSEVVQREMGRYGPGMVGSPNAVRNPVSQADRAIMAELAAICARAENTGLCPAQLPAYTVGSLGGVITGYDNRSHTKVQGFDLAANAKFGLAELGRLNLGSQATLYRDYSYANANGTDENHVGYYGVPRLRATVSASWEYRNYSLSLSGDYVSSRSRLSDSADKTWTAAGCKAAGWINTALCEERVPSSMYWTANLHWTPLPQLKLNLNVRNVFNRIPPNDPRGVGWYVNQHESWLGRYLKVSAEYSWH